MAIVIGKKHFGQYTYEHIFEEENIIDFSIKYISLNGKILDKLDIETIIERINNIEIGDIELHGNNNTFLQIKYRENGSECLLFKNGLERLCFYAVNKELFEENIKQRGQIEEKRKISYNDLKKIIENYIEKGLGSGNVFWKRF